MDDPWLPESPGLARTATPIRVVRYVLQSDDDSFGETPTHEEMPNVACEAITQYLGIQPATALFRYRLGTAAISGKDPAVPEEALSTAVELPRVVKAGDRLRVVATQPDGAEQIIFDGHALRFTLGFTPDSEGVTILAIGHPMRCWDHVINCSYWADSDKYGDTEPIKIGHIPRFNPLGLPNSTGSFGFSIDLSPVLTPIFIDPLTTTAGRLPAYWTLPGAVIYLCEAHGRDIDDIALPDADEVNALCKARIPKDGKDYDPNDPSTYDLAEIIVPDKPLAYRPWIEVVHELLADKGYACAWRLEQADEPEDAVVDWWHRLEILSLQIGEPKDVYLQARGATLDPGLTNISHANITRDLSQVVTRWDVAGALERYEVSIVLACGFEIDSDDANNPAAFVATTYPDAYRLFIADESGEGHVLPTGGPVLYTPLDLDPILGEPTPDPDDPFDIPIRQYVCRRRAPLAKLFSATPSDESRKATLHISTDYAGTVPAVWGYGDATGGTWHEVAGGWEILPDRIGVRLTAADVNGWRAGTEESGLGNSGVVKVVESLAAPGGTNPTFYLRLTCVIEGDQRVTGTARDGADKPFSAIDRPIRRTVDASDRVRSNLICINAYSGVETYAGDDLSRATDEAHAYLLATLQGQTEGEVVIPRFTAWYKAGDRIRSINGRDLGFRVDNPESASEPWYPVVTQVAHDFRDGQHTTLHLSDANAARSSYLKRAMRLI